MFLQDPKTLKDAIISGNVLVGDGNLCLECKLAVGYIRVYVDNNKTKVCV